MFFYFCQQLPLQDVKILYAAINRNIPYSQKLYNRID